MLQFTCWVRSLLGLLLFLLPVLLQRLLPQRGRHILTAQLRKSKTVGQVTLLTCLM